MHRGGTIERRLRTAALALTLAAPITVAAPAASAFAPPLFGFNDSAQTFAADAGLARHGGARIARVPVSWELSEPVRGEYDFGDTDRAVAALGKQGVRVLFVLSAAPAWAAPGCEPEGQLTCGVGNGFAPEYVRFARELLDRYPGSRVQAWNEPDLAWFGSMTPERTAALTRHLYRAVGRRVIGPASSPGDPDWDRYAAAVYRRIPAAVPMGLHLYPRSVVHARGIRNDWRRARAIAGGRPIWVTEVGFAESEYGPAGQARAAAHAYRFLARRGARAIIYHRLRDVDVTGNVWLSSLGVLGEDGRPKPAYRALRRAVRRVPR